MGSYRDFTLTGFLQKSASELNASCPRVMDAETRLDSVVAKNNSFQYSYTLLTRKKNEENIEELRNTLETRITELVTLHSEMSVFRDNGTTMIYQYNDKNGEHLFDIIIPLESYFDPYKNIEYLAREAEKERKNEQGRAFHAATSWLTPGATLGGITGVIMGFKSCSNGSAWNSFMSYGFYGAVLGCIIGGVIGYFTKINLRRWV